MKADCIIIEDEPLALERVKNYVERLPSLQLAATFNNGIDALVYLQSNNADLIFLDINMGDFSGIQLLESAHISSQVIITTAWHEYALQGYDLNVTDYLLKPFSFERFLQAVNKALRHLLKKTVLPERNFIFIKTGYQLEKLNLDELLYIEGMRDYRKIHTTQKTIMTLQTFKELEDEIPRGFLCRVHKSYMLAINKIDAVDRDQIKIRGIIIPVSDTYKKAFFEQIGRNQK